MVLKCGCPYRACVCNNAVPAEEFVRQGLGKMSLAEGNARAQFCALLAGGPAVQQFHAGLINGNTLMTLLNQAMHCTLPPEARYGPAHPVLMHNPVPPQQPVQQEPPRFELPPPMLNPQRNQRPRRNAFNQPPNPEDDEEVEWDEYINKDRPPPRPPPLYADLRLNTFADECVSYAEAEESPWAAVSKWQERFPFGAEDAPEPPWCKDKHWPQSRYRFKPALPGRVVP